MSFPILWYSAPPWAGTGYGQQAALWTLALKECGYDVAIAASAGLSGGVVPWNGIPVFPVANMSDARESQAFIPRLAELHFNGRPGLTFALMDSWIIDQETVAQFGSRVAMWTPQDTDRASALDLDVFNVNPAPHVIAMSKHGEKALKRAGIDAHYVPHAVNTEVFKPEGETARKELGIPDGEFVVGLNAANVPGTERKALSNQVEAFATFAKAHPNATLLIHSKAIVNGGFNFPGMTQALGIADKTLFSDQFAYTMGLYSQEHMARFYRACDVVLNATKGEGFGLPTIEAQACGTPVIVTNAAASPELLGAGWKVNGQREWRPAHQGWWVNPDTAEIVKALESAYLKAGNMRETAAGFGRKYGLDKVLPEFMLPVLSEIGETLSA